MRPIRRRLALRLATALENHPRLGPKIENAFKVTQGGFPENASASTIQLRADQIAKQLHHHIKEEEKLELTQELQKEDPLFGSWALILSVLLPMAIELLLKLWLKDDTLNELSEGSTTPDS